MERFTERKVKEARAAREAQAMLGHPTDLKLVRHNMITGCLVTVQSVKNANAMFGPDLAGVRGRTV
jgi:hypothetical protein